MSKGNGKDRPKPERAKGKQDSAGKLQSGRKLTIREQGDVDRSTRNTDN